MKTKEQIMAEVRDIVVDNLGCEDDEVTPDSTFLEDLGADSLDLVEIIMAIEDVFEIEIPDEDGEKIVTVQDAVDYIHEHTGPC